MCLLDYYRALQKIVFKIDSEKKHESNNTDINIHKKQNTIGNIALNIKIYINDKDYGAVYTIDKNAENGYYLVK